MILIVQTIKGLIECGYCTINDLDSYGRTALFFCANEDNENLIEIAKYLINCGSKSV